MAENLRFPKGSRPVITQGELFYNGRSKRSAHPGGNITGTTAIQSMELKTKWNHCWRTVALMLPIIVNSRSSLASPSRFSAMAGWQ